MLAYRFVELALSSFPHRHTLFVCVQIGGDLPFSFPLLSFRPLYHPFCALGSGLRHYSQFSLTLCLFWARRRARFPRLPTKQVPTCATVGSGGIFSASHTRILFHTFAESFSERCTLALFHVGFPLFYEDHEGQVLRGHSCSCPVGT